MRAGYVIGRFRLFMQVSIGSLVVGDVNGGLSMGQAGPGLVFVGLVSLGSLWRRGFAVLRYGLFFLRWLGTGVLRFRSILVLVW